MRVMVTGGMGFIGSHLCGVLVDCGDDVVVIDDQSTGRWNSIDVDNVYHDIVDPIPDLGAFDRVYSLACPASPKAYQSDPIKTWKTSTVGVMNILEYIEERCPRARFLQASTSEVYGNPLEHPQREGYWGNVNPCGIRSCYDEGKRSAETLICDYQRHRGIDARIARIFNTYGPRMQPDDGRVVSNFIVQALRNEPITVYGDGSQTRSFCYVSDLVTGLIQLMESDVTVPVNLGNPCEFKISELADIVKSMVGSRSKIHYEPIPSDDPLVRKPDIALAQLALAWIPVIGLENGLERTIEYFRSSMEK